MTTLPTPLRGIVPPLVTPLSTPEQLDTRGLERLVEHVLAGGVSGLFLLGTTGEGPSLSVALRRQVIDHVVDQVAERVPVLVGVTDTSLVESIELAEYAADAGASAVVLAGPPYFPIGGHDLREYVRRAAAAMPLPLFLYNMPSHTKLRFDVDTVRMAVDLPQVAGIKDSSGDMIYFQQVVRAAADRPDFAVFVGPEELLAQAVLYGGHGGVCGGANLDPALFVDLYQAAVAGDLTRIAALEARVLRRAGAVYCFDASSAGVIKGIKAALEGLGICCGALAEPLHPLGLSECELIGIELAELASTIDVQHGDQSLIR